MKPLAGANKKTGKSYVRPKEVATEIEAVLEWPLPKAFDLAARGMLRPQTLVYLMRNFRPNRSTPAYDALVVAFFSRLQQSGKWMTRHLSDLDRERVDELVKDKALTLIMKDRLDIFEMSFKLGAERLYLTAKSMVRLRSETEISREDLVEPGSDLTGEEAADALADIGNCGRPLAEVKVELAEVLKLLSEKERLAFVYVYQLGLTEEEAGSRIGCGARNIRHLIKNGRQKVQDARPKSRGKE